MDPVTIKEETDDQETCVTLDNLINLEPVPTGVETSENQEPKEEIKDLPQTNDATDASKFSCAICQKTFTRKYHLDRHLKISKCSGLPVPSFSCDLCNRVYTRKVNILFLKRQICLCINSFNYFNFYLCYLYL